MADIARFTAQAPRRGNLEVSTDTGAASMLARVADVSGQLADRLGQMADRAAKREGADAGAAAAMQVQMPGVDFAFDGKAPATTAIAPASVKVSGSQSQRAAEAKAYLMSAHGKSDVYASGIIGNLMQESSLNPGALNPGDGSDGSNSIGLGQWNSDRARNLRAFAAARGKPVGDFHTQLDFVIHELDTTEKAAGQKLAAARTVDDAVAAMIGFERPQGWSEANPRGGHAYAKRLSYAQSVYGGGAATDPQTTGSTAAPSPTFDAMTAPAGNAAKAAVEASPAPAGDGNVSATPAGGISVTLTGGVGQVPQMKAGTIRGDAYNNAALDIHVNRLDTSMREQMDAISLQHEGDPGGLSGALDALRAGYVKDLPPQAAALVDQSFARQKFALVHEAVTKFNSNLESANLAAYEENIQARTNSAYRLAAKAGLGPEADAAISGELGSLTQSIDASPLTPLQKSRLKQDAVSGVMSARVLGGFEAQKDPAARAAYAKQFQEDWKNGEGMSGQLDVKTYDSINGELIRRTQADEVAANKRTNALNTVIRSRLDYLKKGWPISDGDRQFLKNEVAKTGDAGLTANLDFMDGLADWQKAHVAAKPEIIDAQIAAMQQKIQKEGASEAALTTLDVMEGLRDEMKKGLADDPLSWAQRAGVADVQPLDFSDSGKLASTLTERVADATAIAKHYGIEPKFFTVAETDGLKKMLKQTPLALPSIVSSLSAGLGSATPQALSEISKDAPLLAHVAGLTNATGSQRVAVEVAEVLDRRNQPGYKSTLPSAGKLQSAATEQLGASLIALPNTLNGAMETASALFEARALARGVDMEQFDTAGSPARTLFSQALDEVLGATTRAGVKYGGITSVNGLDTVAPPDLAADSLQGMVANISADDLMFQKSIGSANGIPIRPQDLRGGQLVMTGQGRYRIALGDVAGGDPRYVPGANGAYFELDLGMLKRTQASRGVYEPLATNRGNFR
ncbi:hypothetical protein MCHK_3002 [Mesorhizobium huakuii 7653R]|nr:hypothetical protein MCHK_3002 [Mesorhizobium huakuii 7653R]